MAQGGQVHIFRTTDGIELNNQYVTVTGTAWDVAYMDAKSDANNTVYTSSAMQASIGLARWDT